MTPADIGDWVAKGGLSGGLMVLIFAFYKGWIVLGSTHQSVVSRNETLQTQNETLKDAGAALLRESNDAAKKVIEANHQEREQAARERELLLRMVASPPGSPSPTPGIPPGGRQDGEE